MRQDINGKTEVIGIIGHPIEHTLSPVIHNTISSETGRNAVYVPFHVYGEGDSAADKSDIESVVKGAYKLNIKGFNVTVPYKSDVIPYLSDIDPLAKKIGAVNTLVRTEDGYKGYNTDMPGLYMALQKKGVKVEGSDAVVLGAGGAARAVLAMLINYGAEKIYLVNRSFDKAAALAEEMNGIFASQAVTPVSVNDVDVIKASDTLWSRRTGKNTGMSFLRCPIFCAAGLRQAVRIPRAECILIMCCSYRIRIFWKGSC